MITRWLDMLGAAAQPPVVLLRVVVCSYLMFIGIAAVVGSLHPDQQHRTDAQKVLDLLLVPVRRSGRKG